MLDPILCMHMLLLGAYEFGRGGPWYNYLGSLENSFGLLWMGALNITQFSKIQLGLADSTHIALWCLKFGHMQISPMILCVHFGEFCGIVLSPKEPNISCGWWYIQVLWLELLQKFMTPFFNVAMPLLRQINVLYGLTLLLGQIQEIFLSSHVK